MMLWSRKQYGTILTELRDARAAHTALQEMVAAQHGRFSEALERHERIEKRLLGEIDTLQKRLSFDRRPRP